EGREQLRRLVRGADVLVESYAPGYLDRLGLGYAALSAINPGLVHVSITPFGSSGPKAGWAATDLTALAASGVLLLTGDADRPPCRVVVPQAFLHAGADAATAALIALTARGRDGLGQHVDCSAQTSAMMATQSGILCHGWNSNPVSRAGGGLKIGPYDLRFVYPAKDGFVSVTFLFGGLLGPFTARLMAWMCEAGFVDEATRDKDWIGYTVLLLSGEEPVSELHRVAAAIERFTRTRTKAELYAEAKRRHLLIVPITTTADLVDSPQLAARDFWQPAMGNREQGIENSSPPAVRQPDAAANTTPSPLPIPWGGAGGEATAATAVTALYPGPFAKFSATPIQYRRPAPRLGEHSAEVLQNHLAQQPPSPRGFRSRGARSATERGPGGEAALAGLKILDFTWVFAGPMGVRPLADYGATVVHVESGVRPDILRTNVPYKDNVPGIERGGGYANVSAGKLGLTLNLARPESLDMVRRLVAWADVVVENFSPKAMRNWGLDYAALREINPGIIMVSTCLNGQTGPEAALAGFGTMGAMIAGFGELAGWPDRDPAGPFLAYTDYVSPRYIATAILAAFDHRRRTGEGQWIDLAQAEASAHFIGPALLDYTVNGRIMRRNGNVSHEQAPHGVFPAAGQSDARSASSDGRWVAIACADEAQWQALCRATGNEGWLSDSRFATFAARQANRAALEELIAAWTRTRDVDAIEQTLQAAGVPVHRASSSADAFADPQLAHRGHFVTLDHPELGPVPLEGSRMALSRTPAQIRWPGPTLGQHNELVLREILGLSEDEVTALAVAGALE
ncbi:MAG TPA: CoA transferase, partial [Dehalococcoidia bacterium]|nr:CoA transferase [Dehalococcoidia bacterium]